MSFKSLFPHRQAGAVWAVLPMGCATHGLCCWGTSLVALCLCDLQVTNLVTNRCLPSARASCAFCLAGAQGVPSPPSHTESNVVRQLLLPGLGTDLPERPPAQGGGRPFAGCSLAELDGRAAARRCWRCSWPLSHAAGGFLLRLISLFLCTCCWTLSAPISQAAVPSSRTRMLQVLSHACKWCLGELEPLHNPALLLVAAYFPCDLVFFFS